jgi:hypothetical protein
MKPATVSYTLRIGVDLKRLLEAKAAEQGVSMASLMVRACWQLLDAGVAQLEEQHTRNVPVAGSTPAPSSNLAGVKMNPAMERFFDVHPAVIPAPPAISQRLSPQMRQDLDGMADAMTEVASETPAPPMCSYREWDEVAGEFYGCRLPAHSSKVKHQRGVKL